MTEINVHTGLVPQTSDFTSVPKEKRLRKLETSIISQLLAGEVLNSDLMTVAYCTSQYIRNELFQMSQKMIEIVRLMWLLFSFGIEREIIGDLICAIETLTAVRWYAFVWLQSANKASGSLFHMVKCDYHLLPV